MAALGPHLEKLVNLQTLNLTRTNVWCADMFVVVSLTWLVWTGNDFFSEGAVVLAPHLGKLIMMQTLKLGCTNALLHVLSLALVVIWTVFVFCWGGTVDEIDAEGAAALGPHLGKLVDMHTLHLGRTRVLWYAL